MTDVLLHILNLHASGIKCFADRFLKARHRKFVDFAPVHTEVTKANRVCFIARRDIPIKLGVVERAPQTSVATHGLVDATLGRIGIRSKDGSAGAVTKDDRDRTVGPVNQAGQNFNANDRDVLCPAAADHGVGQIHAVQKSTAGCSKIEHSGLIGSDGFANARRRGRANHLAADAGHDDHVKICSIDAGLSERFQQRIAPE